MADRGFDKATVAASTSILQATLKEHWPKATPAIPLVSIPERAPAIWRTGKLHGDTPADFIRRHYAPWLGKGLTRADLHRLDFSLYQALTNWEQYHKRPIDLDLPTQKEQNDRMLAGIPIATLAAQSGLTEPDLRRRLIDACRYRDHLVGPKR